MDHIVNFGFGEIEARRAQYIKSRPEVIIEILKDDRDYSVYDSFIADGEGYYNMKLVRTYECTQGEDADKFMGVVYAPLTDEEIQAEAFEEMAEIISEQNEAIDELASLISALMEG